jgi:hypothetical protein
MSDENRYCPHCDTSRSIEETVPWQDDFCAACGNAVPEPDDD